MRLLRALAGCLVWILACVVGLLGGILCLTIILIPLGIPLMLLAGKLFTQAISLFVPRSVRHPLQEARKSLTGGVERIGNDLRSKAQSFVQDLRKRLG